MPKLVYVLNEIQDEQYAEVRQVRQEGRYPTACYMY